MAATVFVSVLVATACAAATAVAVAGADVAAIAGGASAAPTAGASPGSGASAGCTCSGCCWLHTYSAPCRGPASPAPRPRPGGVAKPGSRTCAPRSRHVC